MWGVWGEREFMPPTPPTPPTLPHFPFIPQDDNPILSQGGGIR
nr:hypothetical protein [Nostoc sp. ChiSLP01]